MLVWRMNRLNTRLCDVKRPGEGGKSDRILSTGRGDRGRIGVTQNCTENVLIIGNVDAESRQCGAGRGTRFQVIPTA